MGYYHQLLHITTFVFIIHLMEIGAKEPQKSKMPIGDSAQCPVWFYYDNATEQCECYNIYTELIKCIEHRAFLAYSYYLTYSKEGGFSFSYSIYYDPSGFIKPASHPGFIELPSNISELNDYMCGTANRKGFLCSECIDGFGPSATSNSPIFRCMNCTAFTRYGIVVYLLSELVPVTAFYFIVIVFQINLTSAPMVSFILYSQVVHNIINYGGIDQADQSNIIQNFLSIVSVFHGIWNLSFFRYVIPPFCISSNMQIIHIAYIQNISTIFPFILIAITWICIQLHSRNCTILVWLWRSLNQCLLKYINVVWIQNRAIIDTFATIFLLSYAKLMFVLAIPIVPVHIYSINDTTLISKAIRKPALDPNEKLFPTSLILSTTISALIFLTVILPPVLLLAAYPIRAFRSLLFKCCSSRCMASLTIFVEKFYSCYRDGLDGGRDMRSWASIPFLVILFGFVVCLSKSSYFLISVFCTCGSLAVAILQPYKEKFMVISDAFILANAAIISAILEINNNCGATHFYETAFIIFGTLPMIFLVGFITFKTFKTKTVAPLNIMRVKLQCCNCQLKHTNDNDYCHEDEQIQQIGAFDGLLNADRMLRPEQYMQWGYDSVS